MNLTSIKLGFCFVVSGSSEEATAAFQLGDGTGETSVEEAPRGRGTPGTRLR